MAVYKITNFIFTILYLKNKYIVFYIVFHKKLLKIYYFENESF